MASAKKITLRVGETYTLPLKGRGSAGYSWESQLSGDRSAVEVSIRGPEEAPHAKPGRPPATYSANEELVVRAMAQGEVEIQLSLRRAWEKDKPPIEEQVLAVSVKPGESGRSSR